MLSTLHLAYYYVGLTLSVQHLFCASNHSSITTSVIFHCKVMYMCYLSSGNHVSVSHVPLHSASSHVCRQSFQVVTCLCNISLLHPITQAALRLYSSIAKSGISVQSFIWQSCISQSRSSAFCKQSRSSAIISTSSHMSVQSTSCNHVSVSHVRLHSASSHVRLQSLPQAVTCLCNFFFTISCIWVNSAV